MLIKKTTLLTLIAVVAFASTSAFAAESVKVPPTAKLLSKDEVIALYAGKSTTWEHPNTDKSNGTTIIAADLKTMSGTWQSGSDKGEWEGKISFNKDGLYCYVTRGKGQKKYGKQTCNLVFADGKTVYEADPKSKKVLSINVIQ
jgi:outer membrane lipoprotein-sorting protein